MHFTQGYTTGKVKPSDVAKLEAQERKAKKAAGKKKREK